MTALVNTSTGEIIEQLSLDETDALGRAEYVIEQGLKTFVEVGQALATIRDSRLYRVDWATFEDYCQQRWRLSRPRAYQLIEAAEVTGEMSTMVDTPLPSSERQARELSGLPPEQAADVMRETFERTGGNVTARSIRETRQSNDADALAEAVAEFPDLEFYADDAQRVILAAGDLRRFRAEGDLERRLDLLRRSIAIDSAKRAGIDTNGLTATPKGDGYYEMRPLQVAPLRAETCPTCAGSGVIERTQS